MPRATLLALYVAVLVDTACYGMIVPLLPLYAGQLGVGATGVGLLLGAYAGVQLVCLPVIGALADRLGRRRVFLACLLGTALSYLLLALSGSLPLLVCALLLDAATGGNLSVAQALAAERSTPEERPQAMAHVGAAFAVGLVAGPALGGALAGVSLRLPLLVAAGLGLANVLLGLVSLRRGEGVAGGVPGEEAGARSPWAVARGLWSHSGELRRLLLVLFLLNVGFAGLQSNFPLFSAARFGWGAQANGLLFTYVGLCAVLAQGVLVGKLQGRLGQRRLVAVGLGLFALGIAATGLAPSGWAVVPAVGAAALGSSLAIPTLTALLTTLAGPQRQGAALGSAASLLSLAQMLGPPVSGLTFDRAGPPAPYLVSSALAGLALLVFARSQKT
jgi:MFS transporter, DHA1 family, tetracycline resistance protein